MPDVTGGIEEKWGISKGKATFLVCALGFLMGVPFVTGAGSYWIDVTDHFVSNFGLVFVGLMECIVFGYIMGVEHIREHVNEVSDIKLGKWWDYLIKFVAPAILIFIAVASLVELLNKGYEGLPSGALAIGGAMVVLTMLISIIISKVKKWREVL